MHHIARLWGGHNEAGADVDADVAGGVHCAVGAGDEDQVAGLQLVGSGDGGAGVELFAGRAGQGNAAGPERRLDQRYLKPGDRYPARLPRPR